MRFWPFSPRALAAGAANPDPAMPAQPSTETTTDASTPAPSGRPNDLQLEIAPVRKVSRIYPADNIDPLKFKSLCRLADQGYTSQLMELLDDVANDSEVSTHLSTRKLKVAGAPYELLPPENDASDQAAAIADAACAFAKTIPNFTQLKFDLLDAVFRGFADVQPRWSTDGLPWKLDSWEAIESRHFWFRWATEPMVYTEANPAGEPLPAGNLFHVFRNKPGPVSRGGVGRTVGKLWLYKGYNLVDCAAWLERWAHPHVQVQLPPHLKDNSPELEQAKAAARSFIADQVGLVPAGVTISVVETLNKATTIEGVYIAFFKWIDNAFAKVLRGHVLASEAGPSRLGSGGEAKNAGDVAQDIVEFDAISLDEMLTAQLFKPWTVWHFGPNAPAPRFHSCVEKPVDKKAEADVLLVDAQTIQILKKLGLPLDQPSLFEHFKSAGVIEPETPENALVTPAAPALPPGDGDGGEPPMNDDAAPDGGSPIANRRRGGDGACPHCGGFFTLSEAEKKKRSLTSGASRT